MTRTCIFAALACALTAGPAPAQRRQANPDPGTRQGSGTHRAAAAAGPGAVDARLAIVQAGAHGIGGPPPAGPAPAQRRQATPAPGTWQASGTHGAVAAGGQGAVDAGIAIVKAGGNAIDGAAATILALSVTDNTLFCFGGEVPIVVYD